MTFVTRHRIPLILPVRYSTIIKFRPPMPPIFNRLRLLERSAFVELLSLLIQTLPSLLLIIICIRHYTQIFSNIDTDPSILFYQFIWSNSDCCTIEDHSPYHYQPHYTLAPCLYCVQPRTCPCIIGNGFIRKHNLHIDGQNQTVRFAPQRINNRSPNRVLYSTAYPAQFHHHHQNSMPAITIIPIHKKCVNRLHNSQNLIHK